MNPTIRTALPAALSVALVAGALAIPAIATTDDGSTDTDVATTEEDATSDDTATRGADERRHRHPFAHAALHSLDEGELAERLATELDLDTATVQDAVDAVKQDLADERLADAVEAGRLTQDQADRISAAIADGTLDEVMPQIRLEELEARLDEQVAAGALTQEEVDELLAAAEAGDWPDRRDRAHDHGRRGGPEGGRDGLDGSDDSSAVEGESTSL